METAAALPGHPARRGRARRAADPRLDGRLCRAAAAAAVAPGLGVPGRLDDPLPAHGPASYLLLPRGADGKILPLSEADGACRNALFLYAVQLALNFLWPLLYFAAGLLLAALVDLLLLWVLVLLLLLASLRCNRTAALLLLPYLLWLTFAAYLNFGTLLLNL